MDDTMRAEREKAVIDAARAWHRLFWTAHKNGLLNAEMALSKALVDLDALAAPPGEGA